MIPRKVMVSQSNYIPWKGFFDSIQTVDTYVIFDEVQYTRRDWRNRNKIKTPQGSIWLSVPVEVKGKYTQKISETKISDPTWAQQHWMSIQHNYKRAPFFKEMSPLFESLFTQAGKIEFLSEVNELFLKEICKVLSIKTEFINSSEFELESGKSERILGICKQLQTTTYFTGPTAKAYMNESLFKENGIEVKYYNFENYPEYPQLYPPFEHAVSILDVLFMTGPDASNHVFYNAGISKIESSQLVMA